MTADLLCSVASDLLVFYLVFLLYNNVVGPAYFVYDCDTGGCECLIDVFLYIVL